MSAVSADFQVAILMNEIEEAKKVSDELREIGIFAHYYHSLDELWLNLNTSTPDLCIVDVKLMSQGTVLFKNHQKVKTNELKYCFYYKESTKTLLNSTYGMNHYGLIRSEINIKEQLMSALRRRNDELRLANERADLNSRLERLRMRSKRLSEVGGQNEAKQAQHDKVLELIKNFGKTNSPNEFMTRVVSMLEEWEDCKKFGIYHLNKTHQKLVSPVAKTPKYQHLPDLWLAQECNDGIDEYAKGMAYDVTFGLLEGDITTLSIRGSKKNPDIMILADFETENLKHFEWKLLETKLESEYKSTLIDFYKKDSVVTFEENIFNTFKRMDDIQFHQVEADHKFVLLDFSKLTQFLSTQMDNRFHWATFHKELTSELAEMMNIKLKVSILSFDKFVVSIDKSQLDLEFQKLQAFVEDFETWRYFEDTTVMFSNNMKAELKFISPSSINTIRLSSSDMAEMMAPAFNPSERDQLGSQASL